MMMFRVSRGARRGAPRRGSISPITCKACLMPPCYLINAAMIGLILERGTPVN
eukprot:SAG31_NODE_4728_length_3001_cov_2.418677_1_plen_53_part_00